MWLEIAEAALLVGNFVYHRYVHDDPPVNTQVAKYPQTAAGAPIPLLYGRCRVRQAITAWTGPSSSYLLTDDDQIRFPHLSGYLYSLDIFLVLGIPVSPEASHVHTLWTGDAQLRGSTNPADPNLAVLVGDGRTEVANVDSQFGGAPINDISVFGAVEFCNGNAAQTMTGREVALRMAANGVDPTRIPGYRGFLSVLLYGSLAPPADHWIIGTTPTVSAYSFEVSTYPKEPLSFQVGQEMNPVDVIFDLLTGAMGKLGIDSSRVDTANFAAVGLTLYLEGNGYSRCVEEVASAADLIQDVLRQIDGILYEDPQDGKVRLKLVRADYDAATVPIVNPDNCSELQGFALAGFTDMPNKIVVTYNSRAAVYKDDTVIAQNPANAAGQNGEIIESAMSFPGCCTAELAQKLADRELLANSRPIAKCTAIVDRTFYAIVPGDVVAISWPEFALSGALFRVATVSRGTLADGSIKLGLVQEYFQVYRGDARPRPGAIVSFPSPAIGA